MRLNEQEYVAKFKKLALINEAEEQQNIEIDPNFETELEKGLKDALSDKQFLAQIGATAVNENGDINEGWGGLAASFILSAPEIVDALGKAVQKGGEKVNSKLIQKIGEKIAHKGHSIHSAYLNFIIGVLNRVPTLNKMKDEKKKEIAGKILNTAILIAGVAAYNDATSYASAGVTGYAATKAGLGTIKANEISKAIRKSLASWINHPMVDVLLDVNRKV